jgi:predicted transposase/invertase (TIGR01784 family)
MPELVPVILSPTVDFVFKRLFGDPKHLIHLVRFLQSVLTLPADEYEEVTLQDTHINRSFADDKLCVLDIRIKTRSGRTVNVEVQVGSVAGMWDRMQFYSAKLVSEQIGKGDDYAEMPQVITVTILVERLIRSNNRYHHRFRLYDADAGVEFPNSMELHTLELPDLPATSDGTSLWWWLRFMASVTPEDFAAVKERGPDMAELVVRLEELSADKEMRVLMDAREKARRDQIARERYVREEAEAVIARRMLRKKMPVAEVASLTGLSEADVKRLAAEENL